MADRPARIETFLVQAGWGAAERRFLAGDASARSYQRLTLGDRTAVLMDAPPDAGEDTAAFVRVAEHLRHIGLSAPEVLAWDEAAGLLLLEDLGDALLARLAAEGRGSEAEPYGAAADVLLHLQSAPPLHGLPDLGASGWAEAAMLVCDWYAAAITGQRAYATRLCAALTEALHTHADGPRVMILRDYHAENLLWLPDRQGVKRVGILDFQLAQLGQPGYDLVSLCQDARRDVTPALEAAVLRRFLDGTGTGEAAFAAAYAVLGAQRALRILGIFARLSLVAGKTAYVSLIPRVWAQLQRNLGHPALSGVAVACSGLLPEPTPERLERIRAQCGSHAP